MTCDYGQSQSDGSDAWDASTEGSQPFNWDMIGGRIQYPDSWKDLPSLIHPSEIFDIRRYATVPPPPPPPTPQASSHAQDGAEPVADAPSAFDQQYVNHPDVVDIDQDGTHTFRPASSNLYLPPPEPGNTRLVLSEVGLESNDKTSTSHRASSKAPAKGGRLLYHVDNTALLNPAYAMSGQFKTFDVWDLQRLWEDDLAREGHRTLPFTVQTNIVASSLDGVNEDASMRKYDSFPPTIKMDWLSLGPHVGNAVGFCQCYTMVFAEVYSDLTVLTIEFNGLPIRFEKRHRHLFEMVRPATPGSDIEGGSQRQASEERDRRKETRDFSPLKDQFLRILASPRAASAMQHDSSATAVKLIVLDLLRAVIECWAVFVWQLALDVAAAIEQVNVRSRLLNLKVWQKLRTVPRDIRLATDYLFLSIEHELPQAERAKLNGIKVEMESRIRAFDDRIGDLIDTASRYSDAHVALQQDEQALSVKRLTLLAAIFLPLSLASSLLSMGTRAIDLGVLWYDYLGVSVLLVFLAVVTYGALRIWDLPDWGGPLKRLWDGSVNDPERGDKPLITAEKFRIIMTCFYMIVVEFGMKPTKGWKAYGASHYALGLAVVASFVVGMFHDVTLGLTIMGYAAAGWVLAVVFLTTLRFQLFFRRILRRYQTLRGHVEAQKAREQERQSGTPRGSQEGT